MQTEDRTGNASCAFFTLFFFTSLSSGAMLALGYGGNGVGERDEVVEAVPSFPPLLVRWFHFSKDPLIFESLDPVQGCDRQVGGTNLPTSPAGFLSQKLFHLIGGGYEKAVGMSFRSAAINSVSSTHFSTSSLSNPPTCSRSDFIFIARRPLPRRPLPPHLTPSS